MARSSRRRRIGFALGTLVCVVAASGCQTHTIPWEHPTAFSRTPACDSAAPCGDGCYVPPPPTLDSDCYGYRFTCWHPWPEHCQPQCQNGGEQPSITVVPRAPEAASAAPTSTTNYAPSAPARKNAASGTSLYDDTARYDDAARHWPSPSRSAADYRPASNSSRGAAGPTTTASNDIGAAKFDYLSAVAESPAPRRDESVHPASRVTRLYEPAATPADARPSEQSPDRNDADRYRW